MPIITIQSFKEIQLTSEQTANALVVVDIDQTTIDVKKRRIMSDSNKVQRLAFTDSLKGLKTVSGRDPVSIVYGDEGNSYDLVEDGFDKFVAELQARCAHVVALTSRRTGKPPNASEPAQDNLVRKLKALGIDFSKSSPSKHLGVVSLDNKMALVGTESGPKTMDEFEVNGGPQCYEGIVFTAVGEKGVAIGTYSQNINWLYPNKGGTLITVRLI